jgi:hypothetical protein
MVLVGAMAASATIDTSKQGIGNRQACAAGPARPHAWLLRAGPPPNKTERGPSVRRQLIDVRSHVQLVPGHPANELPPIAYPSKEARDAALKTGMKEGMDQSFDRLDEYLRTTA